LQRLYAEISSYKGEAGLWLTDKQVTNSADNFCLHLIGNLNTYIGKDLGKTGYVRNREAEFSLKNIPREELLQQISATQKVVAEVIEKLNEGELENEFPEKVFEHPVTIGYLLIHLTTHLTYHLGQINYHRRLLDK
jgi:uncharacterized damage-inducible protein DinB